MDVSIDIGQALAIPNQHALEHPLEEAPTRAMAVVEDVSVGSIEVMHHLGQRCPFTVRLDVVVVGHQTPAKDLDRVPLGEFGQQPAKDGTLLIVRKNAYLPRTPVHHVEPALGKADALSNSDRHCRPPPEKWVKGRKSRHEK